MTIDSILGASYNLLAASWKPPGKLLTGSSKFRAFPHRGECLDGPGALNELALRSPTPTRAPHPPPRAPCFLADAATSSLDFGWNMAEGRALSSEGLSAAALQNSGGIGKANNATDEGNPVSRRTLHG